MRPARNVATVTSAGRTPRCRLVNSLGDRCTNPVVDDDPTTVQVCPRHALAAALLLQEHGAIKIAYRNITARRTA